MSDSEILSVSGLTQTIIMCALAMVYLPCTKSYGRWEFKSNTVGVK